MFSHSGNEQEQLKYSKKMLLTSTSVKLYVLVRIYDSSERENSEKTNFAKNGVRKLI